MPESIIDMMITPRQGEKIVKAFEIKECTHGRGIFYITNLGIYLETQRHGLILELPFEVLKTYRDCRSGVFRIEWEVGGQRLHYGFKVAGSAKEVFDTYSSTNKEFSQTGSEIDALKLRYC